MQEGKTAEIDILPGANTGPVRGLVTPAKAAALGLLCVALVVMATTLGSGRWNTLQVTASAYNSLPEQTTQTAPDVAAWGDRLVPGMKVIAVSRDLLEMGFQRGTRVTIDGLPGEWKVMDKMNRRWSRHIDIYMGKDEQAARAWGRKEVTIRWQTDDSD